MKPIIGRPSCLGVRSGTERTVRGARWSAGLTFAPAPRQRHNALLLNRLRSVACRWTEHPPTKLDKSRLVAYTFP